MSSSAEPGRANFTIENLDVIGNLQVLVGNADDGAAAVAGSNASGNVQNQAGNGDADLLAINRLGRQ